MHQASALDLVIAAPTLDGPAEARGSAVWNDRKIDLRVEIGELGALIEGRASSLAIAIAGPLTAEYAGTLSPAAETVMAGRLVARAASLRAVAEWLGIALAKELRGLGNVAFEIEVAVARQSVALAKAMLALETLRATGDLRIATGGVRPAVSGRLDIERVDLAAFRAPATTPASASARPGRQGWNTMPIRPPALDAVDLDLAVGIGALAIDAVKTGRVAAAVVLREGRLVADVKEAAL